MQHSFIVEPAADGRVSVRVGSFHRATFFPGSHYERGKGRIERDPQAAAEAHGARIAAMADKAAEAKCRLLSRRARARKQGKPLPSMARTLPVTRPHGYPSDDRQERKAIEYARWLAARDGVDVTGLAGRVEFGHVTDETRTVGRAYWGGTRQVHPDHKRARAVEFGREGSKDRYSRDRRGRPMYEGREKTFEAVHRIEIPHWDFIAREPVEETEPEAAMFQCAA